MARSWAFIGGVLIVSTVTYINMSTIKLITHDVRTRLETQRKRLEETRNAHNTQSGGSGAESEQTSKGLGAIKFPTPTSISTRIKKTWNEDVDRTVRKMQNTNWEKVFSNGTDRLLRFRRWLFDEGVDSEEKKSSSR